MSISLQKGQKVSLTKESKEGLNRVVVGLGWDEVQPAGKGGLFGALFSAPAQAIDCDASAILLQNGKLVDGMMSFTLAICSTGPALSSTWAIT